MYIINVNKMCALNVCSKCNDPQKFLLSVPYRGCFGGSLGRKSLKFANFPHIQIFFKRKIPTQKSSKIIPLQYKKYKNVY